MERYLVKINFRSGVSWWETKANDARDAARKAQREFNHLSWTEMEIFHPGLLLKYQNQITEVFS